MFLTADAALSAYTQAIADHKAAVEAGDTAARESARMDARYAWGWFQAMADRRKADRSGRAYTADRAGFGPVKVEADCEDGHTRPIRRNWDGQGYTRNSARFPAPAGMDLASARIAWDANRNARKAAARCLDSGDMIGHAAHTQAAKAEWSRFGAAVKPNPPGWDSVEV